MQENIFLNSIAKDEKDKLFIKQILEKIQKVENKDVSITTDFLDPWQIYLIECIKDSIETVNICTYGGYENAERKCCRISPLWYTDEQDSFAVTILKIMPNKFSKALSHRDFLGSMLGLGIKREIVGDIIISEKNEAYIIILEKIKSYILENLCKIGRESVEIEVVSLEVLEKIQKKEDVQRKRIIVASLRIDTIIAHTLNISREIVTKLIKDKRVKKNFRIEEKTHIELNQNDIISVQGYGRFKMIEIKGQTKKDNIIIEIDRYGK